MARESHRSSIPLPQSSRVASSFSSLEGSSDTTTDYGPFRRLKFDGNDFTKGRLVHSDRVFLTHKVDKPDSFWYHKMGDQRQAIYSTIYSLFVLGSPESKIVHRKETPRITIVSKAIPDANIPDLEKIVCYNGVARAALMVMICNYQDVRIGNAIIDRDNNFLLIDYEFDTDKEPEKKLFSEFLFNPIHRISKFFSYKCDWEQTRRENDPKFKSEFPDAIISFKNFQHDKKFKMEMSEAIVLFLTFPMDFLKEVIQARECLLAKLIGRQSQWEKVHTHLELCKINLLESIKENVDYLDTVREKIAVSTAITICNYFMKSPIAKEFITKDLIEKIDVNLKKLKEQIDLMSLDSAVSNKYFLSTVNNFEHTCDEHLHSNYKPHKR